MITKQSLSLISFPKEFFKFSEHDPQIFARVADERRFDDLALFRVVVMRMRA